MGFIGRLLTLLLLIPAQFALAEDVIRLDLSAPDPVFVTGDVLLEKGMNRRVLITWTNPLDRPVDVGLEASCGCLVIANKKGKVPAKEDFSSEGTVELREGVRKVDVILADSTTRKPIATKKLSMSVKPAIIAPLTALKWEGKDIGKKSLSCLIRSPARLDSVTYEGQSDQFNLERSSADGATGTSLAISATPKAVANAFARVKIVAKSLSGNEFVTYYYLNQGSIDEVQPLDQMMKALDRLSKSK